MSKVRPVNIVASVFPRTGKPAGWFVQYADRKKGQRWNVCWFPPEHPRSDVEAWVRSQPGLSLSPRKEDET